MKILDFKKFIGFYLASTNNLSRTNAISKLKRSLGLGFTDAKILKSLVDEYLQSGSILYEERQKTSKCRNSELTERMTEKSNRLKVDIHAHLYKCDYTA